MRLSLSEIKIIVQLKNKYFGETSKIFLFGSRVDDSKKGGDIDLYLIPNNQENITSKKIDFLVNLKNIIGEQKIDLILAKNSNRFIESEAKKGIEYR